MKPKPPCQTILPWLKANLGPRCLAPLTGTDARALSAAVQIIELFSYHRAPEVLDAFRSVVVCLQPSVRELAYHGIAHVMDWSDRSTIWQAAGLAPIPTRICAYEPGAPMRDAA
jgi:hypothetical protein